MTEEQKAAERMRRINNTEKEKHPGQTTENLPANYLSPEVIAATSSVKKDKKIFDGLISRTLLDIIQNEPDPKVKLAAIDRYVKLTQSSQIMVKNGNATAAFESNNDGPTTLHLDLSSHIKTDEPEEKMAITSRDLVGEKNAEDADFEIIE